MIVTGDRREEAAAWLAERIPWLTIGELYSTIALIDGDRIVAAVMYDGFALPGVEAHIAIEARPTQHFLGEIFRYPFLTLGCERITCRIASDNVRSIELCYRMGFTREGCLREVLPGLDVYIYGLLRRECRWLGVGRYGR